MRRHVMANKPKPGKRNHRSVAWAWVRGCVQVPLSAKKLTEAQRARSTIMEHNGHAASAVLHRTVHARHMIHHATKTMWERFFVFVFLFIFIFRVRVF